MTSDFTGDFPTPTREQRTGSHLRFRSGFLQPWPGPSPAACMMPKRSPSVTCKAEHVPFFLCGCFRLLSFQKMAELLVPGGQSSVICLRHFFQIVDFSLTHRIYDGDTFLLNSKCFIMFFGFQYPVFHINRLKNPESQPREVKCLAQIISDGFSSFVAHSSSCAKGMLRSPSFKWKSHCIFFSLSF